MKAVLHAFLLLLALPAHALQVLTLDWANASEVAAALRPTLQPGESLSAFEGKLIINASVQREQILAQAARELDTQPAMLDIEVAQDKSAQGSRSEINPGNGTSSNNGWSVNSGSRQNSTLQSLSLLSGKSGSISLGVERPLPWWFNGQGSQRAISGFQVTPRLNGQQVLLDISVSDEELGKGGSVRKQSLITTLSTPLGRWVTLGSINQDGRGGQLFVFGAQGGNRQSLSTVRLRVTRVP
ncbi:hypothetical protein [Craterilacuibacter sinensis]|uniref:Uncharacterized protein n=1 Tax=Craterilacuibacter sinensis TaxID=2686017 RepID=A0A845BUL6_9NEIS|nr:hypothetical protein [Craterilacuibacter sinensis]MXR36213.1 hypothetical protein [Craterilacuibacter sinensis]